MTGVLKRRGHLATDGYTECHLKMKAGIGVMLLYTKGFKIGQLPPEPGWEAWNRSFLLVLRRNQSCWHFDLGLPAFRTLRRYISVVSSVQFMELCYCSPGKWTCQSSTVRPNVISGPSCLGFSSESLLRSCTWAALPSSSSHLKDIHHSLPLVGPSQTYLSLIWT